MLTSDSIEERVWEMLRLKKSLFAGVFDSPTGEVSFEKLGRKTVLQAVKEIFVDQPAMPKPIVDQLAPIPLNAAAAAATKHKAGGMETAAAGLIEAGVKFIESIASDGAGSPLEQILSGLCTRDARTGRPVLYLCLSPSARSALRGRSRAW